MFDRLADDTTICDEEDLWTLALCGFLHVCKVWMSRKRLVFDDDVQGGGCE